MQLEASKHCESQNPLTSNPDNISKNTENRANLQALRHGAKNSKRYSNAQFRSEDLRVYEPGAYFRQ